MGLGKKEGELQCSKKVATGGHTVSTDDKHFQMHAYFNLLTECDEKYCTTPIFRNLSVTRNNLNLSAVKLQYMKTTPGM